MKENLKEESGKETKEGNPLLKKLLIAVPLFIIQLVAVYFITANFLFDESHSSSKEMLTGNPGSGNGNEMVIQDSEPGKFVYPLDDIIINPADTDGKRLLLVSLGLDLNSKQQRDLLREREVILKDKVISILSSKRIEQLNSSSSKDSIRIELTNELNNMQLGGKINRIYFSKFIIQ